MSAGHTCVPMDIDLLTLEQQERLADVLGECLSCLERGETPDMTRVLEENADIADTILANYESMRLLQRAVGDVCRQAIPAGEDGSGRKQLGDFQILREVGRGGMGVVYEAHQLSLDRRVALKILPFAAVLDQKQIARFKNEARAAAQLHHTNIVPVYSVGCERGVHYYAMQYIDGCPLDKAIGRIRADAPTASKAEPGRGGSVCAKAPSTDSTIAAAAFTVDTVPAFSLAGSLKAPDHHRAVAQIGVQVARALQHAHEFGIVHRDVKPSNLLLDDRGKVWITDFGLALFQSDSRVTLSGDIVGTIRYMSPEQATGRAGVIDQRTDVYSLGITLYELLTLREAFEGTQRQAIMYQVENEDPPPPRRIDPSIPRDLDTIIMKAVSKSRDDRYATAGELADDLERFLRGEPTVARRATSMERCAKWARRHKTVVRWAMALAFVALVGLSATTTVIALAHARVSEANRKMHMALKASENNRALAEANEAMAEDHFRQARRMLDRFGIRYAEQLRAVPGAEALRRRVLEDSLEYYRDFVARAGGDSSLQRDLAVTYAKIGAVSEQTGDRNEALDAFNRAREVFEQIVRERPDDHDAKSDLALCRNNIALILAREGKTDAALESYRKAIDAQRELVKRFPENEQYRGDLALSCQNLSLLEHQTGNDEAAGKACMEAIGIEEGLVRRNPRAPRYLSHLATSYTNLGRFRSADDPAFAEQYLLKALEIQKKLIETYPDVLEYKNDLVLNHNYLGALKRSQGKLDEAEAYYALAREVESLLAKKAPAVVKYRLDSAVSENNLGRIYCEKGEYEKAEAVFATARKQLEGLVAEYPENVHYRGSLGGTLNNLGMVLENLGRTDEAVQVYAEAIRQQERAHRSAPSVEQFREFLQRQYTNYIRVLKRTGRHREATEAESARNAISESRGETYPASIEAATPHIQRDVP